MSTGNENISSALIPRGPTAVEKAQSGVNRVLALMVSDTLEIAHRQSTPIVAPNADTLPIPLGIEGRNGLMITIFKKGTVIPCEAVAEVNLQRDSGGMFSFKIYEGFSTSVKDNHYNCTIRTRCTHAEIGSIIALAAFSLDQNGILKITKVSVTDLLYPAGLSENNKSVDIAELLKGGTGLEVDVTDPSGGMSDNEIAEAERRFAEAPANTAPTNAEIEDWHQKGNKYCYGNNVPQDDAEAIKWYRKSAELGHAAAQYRLAFMYYCGSGVQENLTEAVRWYRKAADQGHAFAQHAIGECYSEGTGVLKNDEEAAKWYRKAAEQGHVDAQNDLGKCCQEGRGVPQSDTEAAMWFRKTAEQGYSIGQHLLGECYQSGRGVPQDIIEAVKWYRKAAEQEWDGAQYSLGVCYYCGYGVAKDAAHAVTWFRKAAEQGHSLAQYNLGVCYELGVGVPKDDAEAVNWYRKAATQGELFAQYTLGSCYEYGLGVTINHKKANKWFGKVVTHGPAWMQTNLNQLCHSSQGDTVKVAAENWYKAVTSYIQPSVDLIPFDGRIILVRPRHNKERV